jgi:hypothetical protein
VCDGLYVQWHDMCRTIVINKLHALSFSSNSHTILLTTTDTGIQLKIYPSNNHKPTLHYVTSGDYYYVTHSYNSCLVRAALVSALNVSAQTNLMRSPDPTVDVVGDPSNLNNYLPDSGATQHMTPHFDDLQEVVGGQKLGVEVADGHVIKCSSTGKIVINMQDDNGVHFTATLHDVMYVPGLSRRLFSLTKFPKHDHRALIKHNATMLYSDGATGHPVTLMAHCHGHTIASDLSVQAET